MDVQARLRAARYSDSFPYRRVDWNWLCYLDLGYVAMRFTKQLIAFSISLACGILAGAPGALAQRDTAKIFHHSGHKGKSHAGKKQSLSSHSHYTNSVGNRVHSPAYTSDNKPPAGATAQCRDGKYSFSESRRGTCSHHGGVRRWLN